MSYTTERVGEGCYKSRIKGTCSDCGERNVLHFDLRGRGFCENCCHSCQNAAQAAPAPVKQRDADANAAM